MCCNTTVWIFFGTAGNTVFAPGTKHNVREFMFVQFFSSGSRWRFSCSCNWGVFDVLHSGISRCWYPLSLFLNRGIASILFNLFNWLFTSQRHHTLHFLRVSSRKIHPERSILTFQFNAPSWFQWCLVTNPSTLWRKYHRHSSVVPLRTQPQPALRHQ